MTNFNVSNDAIASEWNFINSKVSAGEFFTVSSVDGMIFNCNKVGDGVFIQKAENGYPETEIVVSGNSVRVSA